MSFWGIRIVGVLGHEKIYNLEDGGRVRGIVLVFMFYFFTESLYHPSSSHP